MSVYYELGIILELRNIVLNKIDKIFIFREVIF